MKRFAWIDNLRVTVIILVVILHTAVTYSGLGGWYYKENEEVDTFSTLFFAFYLTFTQAWFMSALFMVSGYFSHKSLLRKGPSKFIKGRLFRLGIPLLIYIFLIQPVAVKLAHPDLDLADWYFNTYLDYNFIGGTGPLWFVETLLIFSILYVLIYMILIRRAFSIRLRITPINVSLLILFITIFAFVLRLLYPIGTDFYNLQFGFFSAYLIMFIMGILIAGSDLLEKITLKDGKNWLTVSLGIGIPAWFAFMFFGGPMEGNMQFEGGLNWLAFFYALWESFICVTFIIALVGIYKFRVDISSPFQQFLSDNAFGVFVFHAPVLIGISMLLKNVILHPILKFLIVASLALMASFFISWVIRGVKPLKKIFS